MLKKQQLAIKKKLEYKNSLYNSVLKVVKNSNKNFKKLNKEEKDVLDNYKGFYFIQINLFLLNQDLKFYDFIEYGKQKNLVNMEDIFHDKINKLKKDIQIIDNVITKYGVSTNLTVFRGMYEKDDNKKNLLKNLKDTVKKVGNKIKLDTFSSTSFDIDVSLSFGNNRGFLMSIDTNGFKGFYLSWGVKTNKKLKNEKLLGSEFELLLPRGIVLEYLGKENILSTRSNYNNWVNFEKKTKKKKKELYLYKFKIINVEQESLESLHVQKNIDLPVNLLKNMYYNFGSKNNKNF